MNWDRGELVSAEAAQIKDDTCPNCGGKLELAGKGLVRCPYCGTETYLSAPVSGAAAAPAAPAPADPSQTPADPPAGPAPADPPGSATAEAGTTSAGPAGPAEGPSTAQLEWSRTPCA